VQFVFDGCPYLSVFSIVRLGFDVLNRRSTAIDRDSFSLLALFACPLYIYIT